MINVYMCQGKIVPLDIEQNLICAGRQLDKAVQNKADLAVFCHGFLSGTQLGILADAQYFADCYNSRVAELALKYPNLYILADRYYNGSFENALYHGADIVSAENFKVNGFSFTAFNSVDRLKKDADEIHADCIILNRSRPIIAGNRAMLKNFLKRLYKKNGATVMANLGGWGFSSHPYVYLPAIACFDKDYDVFTNTLPEFINCEKNFSLSGEKCNADKTVELPPVDFEINYNVNPLIPMQVNEKEYCLDLFHLQSVALADRLANINTKKAVVAVSGGLDSALALLVTVNAFDMLGLDRAGIYSVSMPGFGTSVTTKSLAQQLVESLGLGFKLIDITDACRQALKDIGHDGVTADVTFENVQARMRTLNSLNIANSINGIMIGTGDLSEEALGFSTYGGDHLAGYNVNSSISKTVIRTMLPYVTSLANLNSAAEVIDKILNIPVSPELVPHGGEILQKTEEILAPYKLIDFFIYCFVYAKNSPDKMVEKAQQVFGEEFSREYLTQKANMFFRRFITGQFKRSCAPEGARLTHVHLCGDERSVPSDSGMGLFNYYLKKI